MCSKDALSVSIGVLGGLATLLTATIIDLPVWVIFIAWASFFIVGGGVQGLVRSVASNLTGIAVATLTLLAISAIGDHAIVAAVAVGLGSAAMVQASKVELLSATPAIVWGFASTVGTVAVRGDAITTTSLRNPALIAASAMILGGLFGIASEWLGTMLTSRPEPEPKAPSELGVQP